MKCPGESRGILLCICFVMGLNGIVDFFVIIEEIDTQCAGYEDAGNQCGGLNALGGGSAGTVGTPAKEQ